MSVKQRRNLPASGFLSDKIWAKLFDAANEYQTVLVTFVPKGAECAIAGIGLQHSFKERESGWNADHENKMADTLSHARPAIRDHWRLATRGMCSNG